MNSNAKIAKLYWVLWASYYEERWVPMEEIIERTKMSSFNQRIQAIREARIDVQNRMDGKKSFYRLFTDPESIDWKTLRAVIPRQPKRRHGGKVEKRDDGQGVLL